MSDQYHVVRARFFIGPNGRVGTQADLPPRTLKRRLACHKAEVVAAVRCGLLTREEASLRYHLTLDRYLSWERAFEHDARTFRAGLTIESRD
jgi:hypothetical protein